MISRSAVLTKINEIKILDLNLPFLKRGQVLVELKYASICHTQVQEINGSRGEDKFLPHCLGHEATGKVLKIGKDVRKVKKGDNVCLTWVFSEGINAGGSIYRYKDKKINAGPVNTFSKYALVSENKIQKLNKNSNLIKSVLLGCAAPTAFNCIFLNTNNTKQKKILILGCGGVGLLAVYASKKSKFKEIAIVEKYKNKISIAKKLGANKVIKEKDVQKFRDKFDYVLECTGNPKIVNECIYYAKSFGGKVFIIGNYKNNTMLKIDPWQLLYGKKISGSWEKKFNYDKNFKLFEKYLKNFKCKYLFGNKIYNLDEISIALEDFQKGKVIRPLIKI